MNWFKQNWLWLIINIIAIVSLIGVFSVFNLEFSADGTPTISIEQPSFPDRELEGATIEQPAAPDGERGEHSALSFPIHTSGEWAIRWLVLSLTCTPLYILFGWRSFLTVKKAAGLYAFTHAGLHLLFFVADRGWLAVFDEFNFIVGLLSLLIMVPLALTSNEWSMKFMGKSWKLMHRAAYAAGVLAVLHVIFLGKGSWLLYAVLLTLGFVTRLPSVRKAVTGFRRHILSHNPTPA